MIAADYRREMNHNYLILKKEESQKDSYIEKMICENEIPGLLSCRIRCINEVSDYYYDISRKQSMYDIFQQKKIEEDELRILLIKLNQLFEQMEGYLLPDDKLILSPQYIYWNYEAFDLYFCYYPSHSGTMKETFVELVEFIIEKADHENEQMVDLAYNFYQNIMEENYEIGILVQDYVIEKVTEEVPYEPDIRIQKEEYYFKEPDQEEQLIEEAPAYFAKIVICAGIIISTVSLYLMILLRPSVLDIIGLSQKDYIKIGGIIGIISAGTILVTMNIHNRMKSEKRNKIIENEMEENERREFYIDRIEEKAFDREQEEQEGFFGDTVLLTDDRDFQEEAKRKTGIPCLFGESKGKEIKLIIDHNPYIIGKLSKNADGIIEDKKISRIHASIREEDEKYYLSDLNSTNGTCYNGRKLEIGETVELFPKDQIKLADITVIFQYRE